MASTKQKSKHPALSKTTQIEFYRTMLKIRRVEETLMEIFASGEIPGFLHVCIGQEATPVAVCALLESRDYMGSTHRSHGHALAKGIDLKRFMAELLGRQNGFCLGRSGSMHVADKNLGILGANGIVGGGIPIATGAGFAAKRKHPGRVSVAFFGDGATGQGTFHESLNMAAVWKLPVVYVCENNGWAEFSPTQVHMAIENIADRAKAYNMPGVIVSNDFMEIYEASKTAVERARKGDGPTLIEVKCNRWHGHFVGDPQKYRGKEAVDEAMGIDCIKRYEEFLGKAGVLNENLIAEIEDELKREIAEAVDFARKSPEPSPEALDEALYV